MDKKQLRRLALLLGTTALVAAVLACGTSTPAAPTSSPTTGQIIPATQESPVAVDTATTVPVTITHTMKPGELPASFLSEMTDRDSSVTAAEKRANGGENFSQNLFERPFNANTMDVYYPYLDITRGRLYRDDTWIYINITLVGADTNGGMPGDYGLELDLNLDGRGDMLVMASKPGATWSTDGVQVWNDTNHDVGGEHPIQSDPPANTDGYETVVFNQGVGTDSDAAWARISPTDPKSVQIAFKRTLINDSGHFLWGVWAMNESMFNPAWFDYNDHFTAVQAGSPLTEMTTYYPIKAMAQMDNTCRAALGFKPTGSEPGVCPVPVTPTPVPPAKAGSISGEVYDNGINGGETLKPSSIPLVGIHVEARSGTCLSAAGVVGSADTNKSGMYTINVPAGSYCIMPNPAPVGKRGGTPLNVTVLSGGSVSNVNFGYWTYLGIR